MQIISAGSIPIDVSSVAFWRIAHDAIERRKKHRELCVDQIDLCDAEHEIAVDDHALVEEAVNEIEERCLAVRLASR